MTIPPVARTPSPESAKRLAAIREFGSRLRFLEMCYTAGAPWSTLSVYVGLAARALELYIALPRPALGDPLLLTEDGAEVAALERLAKSAEAIMAHFRPGLGRPSALALIPELARLEREWREWRKCRA